ncbi:MAG TPA: hypothetical protein VN767_22245 [Streptosporangiaceae bacterium]|nr:hypothetical protein [Streptosporangiaceae bacterium]
MTNEITLVQSHWPGSPAGVAGQSAGRVPWAWVAGQARWPGAGNRGYHD